MCAKKVQEKHEGFVLVGSTVDGRMFRPVASRAEGIAWMQHWLGRVLDYEYFVGDVISNDYGIVKMIYTTYAYCGTCKSAITMEDYYEHDGICQDCYYDKEDAE